MRKKIVSSFLLIIFTFIHISLYSQKENLRELNLKGQVKYMKTIHKNFFLKNDSIKEYMPEDNDPFWFRGYTDFSYNFDQNGYTKEFRTFDIDAAYVNLTKFTFDKDYKLIKQEFSSDNHKRGYLEIEYDDRDRINCIIRSDENDDVTDIIFHLRESHQRLPLYRSKNNIWVYNYDNNGLCIEEKSYTPAGKLVFRHVFFYNNNGKVELMTSYDHDNIQNLSVSYKYDSNGNVSQIVNITPTKFIKEVIKSDTLDNEISRNIIEKYFIDNKKIQNSFINIYLYDSNNNWYKKYCYYNNEPSYMQERKIEYYSRKKN